MKRRILVLNERDPHHPLTGGAETHIFEIFERLARRGYDVTLLAASFPGSPREEMVQGVRVVRLVNRYFYYGVVAWAARREAKRMGGVDVVVDVLNKLPFCSRWLLPYPCFAIVHHLFGTTAFRQVPLPIAVLTYLAEKLIPSAYRGVPMMAISPSTKDDLVERGLAASQIWVVPPGVDRATHLPTDDGLHREPLILWVGRLEPYKRADLMIEAMPEILAKVPDARLVIVGAGTGRSAFEARVVALGLGDHVSFTGFVSEEVKIDWLRKAAVTVQTSEKEGWGMTVIEGNVCNTPAVASDVPGLRDSVQDGVSGLLFPYGDRAALARAILRILTEPELREKLVREGCIWGNRFGWDEVADDTATLIERAISPSTEPVVLTASPF